MKKFFVSYLTILSFCGILYPSKEKEKNLRNKVYVVFSEWDESFDLFGIYASFEGAKNAINNWAGDEDGEWTSENHFEIDDGSMYRIVARTVEP